MDYAYARQHINTGDLIAVKRSGGWFGRLTQLVTRSPYTHAGIAIWIADGLYMAELNRGKNHLVPLSQLKEFDVCARPADLAEAKVEEAVHIWLRLPIDYGYLALLAIGLLELLRLDTFIHWRRILVCTGYCVAIYETAGWPECTRILSPRALVAMLRKKALVFV